MHPTKPVFNCFFSPKFSHFKSQMGDIKTELVHTLWLKMFKKLLLYNTFHLKTGSKQGNTLQVKVSYICFLYCKWSELTPFIIMSNNVITDWLTHWCWGVPPRTLSPLHAIFNCLWVYCVSDEFDLMLLFWFSVFALSISQCSSPCEYRQTQLEIIWGT